MGGRDDVVENMKVHQGFEYKPFLGRDILIGCMYLNAQVN